MTALPGLVYADHSHSFGNRARPAAVAVFAGVDDAMRTSVEARVLADRLRWQTNGDRGTTPFHTLGSPTYIRGVAAPDPALQQYLRDRFGDVHAVLLDRLRNILEAPVSLSPQDSAPGFHIFEAPAGVAHPPVGMHLDAQYRHLGDPGATGILAGTRLLSATIVVRADGGAGLDYVPLADIPGLPMKVEPTHRLAYEPGRLVVQFGLFPHTVAGFGPSVDPLFRITLQAHAIRGLSGSWRLYW